MEDPSLDVVRQINRKAVQVKQLNTIFDDRELEERLVLMHNTGMFREPITTLERLRSNDCVFPSTVYIGLIKQINRFLKDFSY